MKCLRAEHPAEALAAASAALTMVFQARRAVAVLFTQSCSALSASRENSMEAHSAAAPASTSPRFVLDRREAIPALMGVTRIF